MGYTYRRPSAGLPRGHTSGYDLRDLRKLHVPPRPVFAQYATPKDSVEKFYLRGARTQYKVGKTRILSHRRLSSPLETPADDAAIYALLRRSTTIPVPKIVEEWDDPAGGFHFQMREFIPGKSMKTVFDDMCSDAPWAQMSDVETWDVKQRVASQAADYLRQLRKITAPYMGRVNRHPLVDHVLFLDTDPIPKGPFTSADELWDAMVATIDHPNIPKDALELLREKMPECEPFTFTHGDLSHSNFLVREVLDGGTPDLKLVGILDWEWSWYAPVWYEYAKMKLRVGEDNDIDPDWWELMGNQMGGEVHEKGYEFLRKFRDLGRLRFNPGSREGLRTLDELRNG